MPGTAVVDNDNFKEDILTGKDWNILILPQYKILNDFDT